MACIHIQSISTFTTIPPSLSPYTLQLTSNSVKSKKLFNYFKSFIYYDIFSDILTKFLILPILVHSNQHYSTAVHHPSFTSNFFRNCFSSLKYVVPKNIDLLCNVIVALLCPLWLLCICLTGWCMFGKKGLLIIPHVMDVYVSAWHWNYNNYSSAQPGVHRCR